MTRRLLFVAACVAICACGGGGDSGGGGVATTYYVRVSGNDASDGLTAATAFSSIGRAALLAGRGDTVIVGPGFYSERQVGPSEGTSGSSGSPILFLADRDGTMTGDVPGDVVLSASGGSGFSLRRVEHVIIDGFVVEDAAGENAVGILVRSRSSDVTIRNCVIRNNLGDGIRVQSSSDVRIFNNLIHDNSRNGIRIAGDPGSSRAQIVNNTVVRNRQRGVFIGTADAASTEAFLRNNILQFNESANLQVTLDPDSSRGLSSSFNVVFPERYSPRELDHSGDIIADALFVDAGNGDFHLLPESPAVDAGATDIDAELFADLLTRSTAPEEFADVEPIDIGYHY